MVQGKSASAHGMGGSGGWGQRMQEGSVCCKPWTDCQLRARRCLMRGMTQTERTFPRGLLVALVKVVLVNQVECGGVDDGKYPEHQTALASIKQAQQVAQWEER